MSPIFPWSRQVEGHHLLYYICTCSTEQMVQQVKGKGRPPKVEDQILQRFQPPARQRNSTVRDDTCLDSDDISTKSVSFGRISATATGLTRAAAFSCVYTIVNSPSQQAQESKCPRVVATVRTMLQNSAPSHNVRQTAICLFYFCCIWNS